MPNVTCDGCVIRLVRAALEWGANYQFTSCAMLNLTTALATDDLICNGCSAHGVCVDAKCVCDSSPATGFFYGEHCERENECETDGHCGPNGACVDVGDVSGPAKQCFCENGFWGKESRTLSGMSRHDSRSLVNVALKLHSIVLGSLHTLKNHLC